jgi:hypothetical protein
MKSSKQKDKDKKSKRKASGDSSDPGNSFKMDSDKNSVNSREPHDLDINLSNSSDSHVFSDHSSKDRFDEKSKNDKRSGKRKSVKGKQQLMDLEENALKQRTKDSQPVNQSAQVPQKRILEPSDVSEDETKGVKVNSRVKKEQEKVDSEEGVVGRQGRGRMGDREEGEGQAEGRPFSGRQAEQVSMTGKEKKTNTAEIRQRLMRGNSPNSIRRESDTTERSKSSNRGFRRLGEKKVEAAEEEGVADSINDRRTKTDLREDNQEEGWGESRKDKRTKTDVREDKTSGIGRLDREDAGDKLPDSLLRKGQRRATADQEVVDESNLGEKIRRIVEASGPRSPKQGKTEGEGRDRQGLKERGGREGGGEEEERGGEAGRGSGDESSSRPQSRFNEIRKRFKQQRAKSNHPTAREGQGNSKGMPKEGPGVGDQTLTLRPESKPQARTSEPIEDETTFLGDPAIRQLTQHNPKSFLNQKRLSEIPVVAEFAKAHPAQLSTAKRNKAMVQSDMDLPDDDHVEHEREADSGVSDYKAMRELKKQQLNVEKHFQSSKPPGRMTDLTQLGRKAELLGERKRGDNLGDEGEEDLMGPDEREGRVGSARDKDKDRGGESNSLRKGSVEEGNHTKAQTQLRLAQRRSDRPSNPITFGNEAVEGKVSGEEEVSGRKEDSRRQARGHDEDSGEKQLGARWEDLLSPDQNEMGETVLEEKTGGRASDQDSVNRRLNMEESEDKSDSFLDRKTHSRSLHKKDNSESVEGNTKGRLGTKESQGRLVGEEAGEGGRSGKRMLGNLKVRVPSVHLDEGEQVESGKRSWKTPKVVFSGEAVDEGKEDRGSGLGGKGFFGKALAEQTDPGQGSGEGTVTPQDRLQTTGRASTLRKSEQQPDPPQSHPREGVLPSKDVPLTSQKQSVLPNKGSEVRKGEESIEGEEGTVAVGQGAESRTGQKPSTETAEAVERTQSSTREGEDTLLTFVEPSKKNPGPNRFLERMNKKAEEVQQVPAEQQSKGTPVGKETAKGRKQSGPDQSEGVTVEAVASPKVRRQVGQVVEAEGPLESTVAQRIAQPEGEGLMDMTEGPKKQMPKNRFADRLKKNTDTAEDKQGLVEQQKDSQGQSGTPQVLGKSEKAKETTKGVGEGVGKEPSVAKDEGTKVSSAETPQPGVKEAPKEAKVEEDPNSLTAKLKSANFKVRQEAYEEIKQWKSAEVTPAVFARSLHNCIKDKHPLSIEALLDTIDSFFDTHPECFPSVDFKALFENVADHLFSNVKGPSKEKTLAFVVRLWEMSDFDVFLEQLNELLKSGKPKRQECCLSIVMELMKHHKVDEMKQCKTLWPEIDKLMNSRTAALKTQTMELYKEAYLWIGEVLRPFLKEVKKVQMEELNEYFKSIDPSKMKKVEKKAVVPKSAPQQPNNKPQETAKDNPPEDQLKAFNNKQWVDAVMATANEKDQVDKIEELNDRLWKNDIGSSKEGFTALVELVRRGVASRNEGTRGCVAKTAGILADKLGKSLSAELNEFYRALVPGLASKTQSESFISALSALSRVVPIASVVDDLKANLDSKNKDLVLSTLLLVKSIFDSPDKCAHPDKSVLFCELLVGLADDKNNEVKNVAHQILASQLNANESRVQPLLQSLSPAAVNSINQMAASIKLSTRASMLKDDSGVSPVARANEKSNAQKIAQIKEDALGNRIIKTSDAKNFPNHLLKNMNFLVETTAEFKGLFPEEAAEVLSFVEALTKLEKSPMTEPVRLILFQFFIEQTNNSPAESLGTTFDQFYSSCLKITSNKTLVQDLLSLLLKKQIRLNKEFFQTTLALFEKEVGIQSALASLPLRPLVDFLRFQFSNDNAQLVFKKTVINTMRVLIRKFGDGSVAEFPAMLLQEFDTISEAQKVFEKIIERLNDSNPDKRKAALIDLANYNDPSTILTFWSNEKFVLFLKRQITIETKSSSYLVLIKILDHYLETRTISFADFNIKTYTFVFHAVLMNYYDNKEDSYQQEIEALMKKSVQILTPTLIFNEMIAADMDVLAWKEQILHFLNEFALEIEPSMRTLNYLIQILNHKNQNKEYTDLLTRVLLRFKTSQNQELIAKGNENKLIREIWMRKEEELVINEEFVKANRVFEDPKLFAAAKDFLMRTLHIDEKAFHTRNIESIDFKLTEASFKTKMAYWYLRSVENIPRNNDFIIRQMYINESYREEEISLALATKIVLQVLKNLYHWNYDKMFENAFKLMGQITAHLGMEGVNRVMTLLDFDNIDYEFFNLVITNVESTGADDDRYANHQNNGPRGKQFGGQNPYAKTPVPQKEHVGMYDQTNGPKRPNQQGNNFEADHFNNTGTVNPDHSGEARFPVDWGLPSSQQLGLDDDGSLESPQRLQSMFQLMLTYQLDDVEKASNYFKELCASKSAASVDFVANFGVEIVNTFLEICRNIFGNGINYELEPDDYSLIFTPFIKLLEKEGFMQSLEREKVLECFEFFISQFIRVNNEKKQLDQTDQQSFKVAECIFKFCNSALLKMLLQADPNFSLFSLFYLIVNCQHDQRDKGVEEEVGLAFKCLLRMTKNLDNLVDRLQPAIVLNSVNDFLKASAASPTDPQNMKIVKNLLAAYLARVDFPVIQENYSVLFGNNQETLLYKWIMAIVNSQGGDESRVEKESTRGPDPASKLIDLINDLNKQASLTSVKSYIGKFKKVLEDSPGLKITHFEEYFNSREQYVQIVKAMKYYSVGGATDGKQAQGNPQSSRVLTGEAQTLQAKATPLSSVKASNQKRSSNSGKGKTDFDNTTGKAEG